MAEIDRSRTCLTILQLILAVAGASEPLLGQARIDTIAVTFFGRVVSESRRTPLLGAVVGIDHTHSTGTSGDDGRFRFTARLTPGDYQLRVRHIGYEASVRRVTVRDSSEIQIPTFRLEESKIHLDDLKVPVCTPIKREPKSLPKGAWVASGGVDSTGHEILVLCRSS